MRKLKQFYQSNPMRFMIIAYGLYIICFFLLDNWDRSSYTYLHSSIDNLIPFATQAVYFYISWFPLMVVPILTFWHRKSYEELWDFIMPMLMAMFLSLLIYLFWPNALRLRPAEVTGNSLSAWITRAIQSADSPTNVCPSIHVSTTILIDCSLHRSPQFRKKGIAASALLHLLVIAICISVMMLKQHSIIDVASGAVFAFVLNYLWVHKLNPGPETEMH